jgi:DNA-directed RNA polymerase specialized sigma24 family protein
MGSMGMIDDVRRAQAGDRAAFRRLVERFQGMAVGYAVGWVGDAAEDVAQEAFVEAFLHLSELRDAAAFPGWPRRILRKHRDRRTRRRPGALDAEPQATEPDEASLDPELAEAGIYPAIDRELTRSTAKLAPEHARIADAVPRSTAGTVHRFFAQWFAVYQHRSGKAGEFWCLEATLAGFQERLGCP